MLAGFEKDPIRADFRRLYSLDRLPNDPRLCQRAVEFLRKQGKEDLAREVEARHNPHSGRLSSVEFLRKILAIR
jgi:hypothetical protein